MSSRKVLFLLFLVSAGLGFLVSPYASQLPDGLEKVAHELGFMGKESMFLRSPVPGYLWPDIKNERLATSVAGLTGTLLIFLISVFIARAIVRRSAGKRDAHSGHSERGSHETLPD